MPKANSDERCLDIIRKKSAFQRLVHWITERESIRLKKEAGEPRPWTLDRILQSYRFTCPRRMDDRVSKWLLSWYVKDHQNIVPAAVLARFVNKPETLEGLKDTFFNEGTMGGPATRSFMRTIEDHLRALHKHSPVFNGAYIIPPGKGKDKIDSVVNYICKGVVDNRVPIDTASMQRTHAAFMERDGFGSFMAGQVVHDLVHVVTGTWADQYSWAPQGPGSMRGMERLLRRPDGTTPRFNFLDELRALRDRLQYSLPEDLYAKLDMMSIQNVCCEMSKYEKVLWNEGRAKQLYNGRG